MQQESSQSISNFYFHFNNLWEQLSVADSQLKCYEDIELCAAYRDRRKFFESLHEDFESNAGLSFNDVFHEHIKHIEIYYHFVNHHLQQGTLYLLSVSSENNLVDIFTKPHPLGWLDSTLSFKLQLAPPS